MARPVTEPDSTTRGCAAMRTGLFMRRRAVAATVLAFLTAGVATVAAPQPAMAAERHGCTGVGPKVDIRGIGVSNGESCVFVVGSGLRIDRAYAAFFTSVKPICNWWVDIDTPAE